ncbi:MAG: diguanylate cyclase domain-containing protein, partial [Vitreoscilla sp.]
LGVDLAGLHAWFDYGNTRPGRMAPNTALGFFLIAAAIALADRVTNRRSAISVVTLTFFVLAIGLTGLVGYLLAPDLLFGWARSARMAVHTATGMLLASVGLWLSWFNSGWYREETYFREDGKIRVLSAAILVIVTITTGLTGFALLERSLETSLEARLEAVVKSRGPWVAAFTERTAASTTAALRLSGLEELATTLLRDPAAASSRDAMSRAAARWLREGDRGLVVQDSTGQVVQAFGTLTERPPFIASLDARGERQIVWDGSTLLRLRHPLPEGRGQLVVDVPMPELGAPFFDMARMGQTAELSACVQQAGDLLCLPNGKNAKPFLVDRHGVHAHRLPMELALDGQRGIVDTFDYRGHAVIAAYGLLAPGLGFVAKQDTQEAFTPIREALATALPLIMLVALAGAALMYGQLNPLVARMRRSETMASVAAAKMQTIMDAAGDGIVTIGPEGRIASANGAADRLFGFAPGELVGQDVTRLMPDAALLAQWRRLAGVHAASVIGTPNVQIDGLRKDGDVFPLELTLDAVRLDGPRLVVGVMRDITVRREMEERLARLAQYDGLTGLPNRMLFMDRLATAIERAARSHKPLALMFIDLDGFKAINDTLGHGAGDQVLVQTALRLTSAVRRSDTVARLAGDEFTVILENLADPADADLVVEKILAAMRAPFATRDAQSRVTASVGLVLHHSARDGNDVAELLHRADEAMYAAKRSGKDAVYRAPDLAGTDRSLALRTCT